uniref:Uncharacterized protein n=1 Tax=Cacopsylla melanoneura TaxID=428564 RepID=A0A8D8QLH7_9HEMI
MCACFKHWGLHFFNPNLPRISQRASSLKPVILIARLKIPSLTNRKFRFPHLIICPNFQDLIGPKTKRKGKIGIELIGKPAVPGARKLPVCDTKRNRRDVASVEKKLMSQVSK